MNQRKRLAGLGLIVLHSLVLGWAGFCVSYLRNKDAWPPSGLILFCVTLVLTGIVVYSINMIIKKNKQEDFNGIILWLGVVILTYPFMLYGFQGIVYKFLEL